MQHFTKCIVLLYEDHRKRRKLTADSQNASCGKFNF